MKNLFLQNPARALVVIALVLAIPFMVLTANAQINPNSPPPAPPTSIQNVSDVYRLINTIFNILFWGLIVLASIFIIMAAFSYLTAGGDPEKVKVANQKVIYAAVAVVVAVLAKAIPAVVCSFLASGGCQTPTGTL